MFSEAVRDLKIKQLPTLKDDKFAATIYDELRQSYPDHLPLYVAEISRLYDHPKDHYADILQLVDKIMSLAEPKEVLQYFGARNDENEENLLKKE